MVDAPIEQLGLALVVVFLLTALGYFMGHWNIIKPSNCVVRSDPWKPAAQCVACSQGMGQFLGYIALPSLLFRAMATLDWASVEVGDRQNKSKTVPDFVLAHATPNTSGLF